MKIEAQTIQGHHSETVVCTASIGVVVLAAGELSCDVLIRKADQGLYAAKAAGRNCVALAADLQQEPQICTSNGSASGSASATSTS